MGILSLLPWGSIASLGLRFIDMFFQSKVKKQEAKKRFLDWVEHHAIRHQGPIEARRDEERQIALLEELRKKREGIDGNKSSP